MGIKVIYQEGVFKPLEKIKDIKEGEEVKSCCGQIMVKKEEYIDKLSAQLKEWGVQIDRLKDRAGKGTAEIKTAIDKIIERMNITLAITKKNEKDI